MNPTPDPSHSHAPSVSSAAHAHDPAHAHGGHDIKKDVIFYIFVGIALLVGTGITVWLSYVDFGTQKVNIIVAMIVASIKAGLVAAVFMHLLAERWTIYRVLIFTVIFVLGLFLLTLLAFSDPIRIH